MAKSVRMSPLLAVRETPLSKSISEHGRNRRKFISSALALSGAAVAANLPAAPAYGEPLLNPSIPLTPTSALGLPAVVG